jgi:hypothetical protein
MADLTQIQKEWEKKRWGERKIGERKTMPTILCVIDCKKTITDLNNLFRFI